MGPLPSVPSTTAKKEVAMSRKSLSLVVLSLFLLLVSLAGLQQATAGNVPRAGDAITGPRLWVSPLSLDFGPVGVGFTSATQMVTITNAGDATLTNFAGGGVYPPFWAGQDCAAGVAPGGHCHYYFTFSPTATGTFTTTSNSSTNAGPFTIALQGTGAGAGLHVSPLALDFGSVYSGTTSAEQIVTITNTGYSTLTNFAGGGVYPPFWAGQDCAAGVPPGSHCHYYFTFSPTATGTFTTTSNSSTNAGPFTIALQGRGRTVIFPSGQRVTPRSLDFGPVGVGMESGPLVVTITNQSWFITLTNFAGGGLYPPFQVSQDCAGGVPPGESCHYYFRFAPTATGTFSATSRSSDNVGSFDIDVRGTGVGAALYVTPLWLDFGFVAPGNTSPVQTATIYNTGMSTLTNFAGGGLYPPFSASQDCASGVPPGESCRYYFRFAPTRLGRFTAYSNSSTNGGSFTIKVQGGVVRPVYLPVVFK
jgi:hypothetical protein